MTSFLDVPDNLPSSPMVGGTYIVGWGWGSIMKAAKAVGNVGKDVGKAVVNPRVLKAVAPIVANAIPGGGVAYAAANQINDIVSKAREGAKPAIQAVSAVRQMAVDGNAQALEVAKVMKAMSDKLDQKMAGMVAQQAQAQTPTAQVPQQASQQYTESATPQKSSGMSTSTMALIAAVGIGGLVLLSRK